MAIIDWSLESLRPWLISAVIVVVAFVIERLLTGALRRLQDASSLAALPGRIMRRAVQWFILAVVLASLAVVFGQEASDLWRFLTAVLAVVGVGFVATWSFLSNVLAGFIILIWRPFRIGERVELLPDGPSGEVQDINTMFTVLRGDDGSRFAVPNNQFLQHAMKCTPAAGMTNAEARMSKE